MGLIKLKTEYRKTEDFREDEENFDMFEPELSESELKKIRRKRRIAFVSTLIFVVITLAINLIAIKKPDSILQKEYTEVTELTPLSINENNDHIIQTKDSSSLAREVETPEVTEEIPEIAEEIPEVVEETAEPEQDESPPDNNQIREWSDGERLWKAEYSEQGIGFWYSEDSGLTWNQNERATISILTNDFSIEGDSSQVLIVYTDGFDIMSVKNSGHYPAPDFTWTENPIKIYNGHSLTYNYSQPYITKDKEGKLWTSAFFFTTEIQEHTYVVDDTDAQGYKAEDYNDGLFSGIEYELTEAEYLNIDDDDDSFAIWLGNQGAYGYHHFDFTIDEDTADITQVDVTWKGWGDGDYLGTGASLWVKESSTWTEKDSGTSGSKETLTTQYTSDFSNIISSDHMDIVARCDILGTRVSYSTIYTYYAEVKITYDEGAEIPEGTIPFFLVAPFLPRLIYNLRNRKKKKKGRNITINLITVVLLALSLFYLVFSNSVFDFSGGKKEKYYKVATESIPGVTSDRDDYTVETKEITHLIEEMNNGPRKISYNVPQFMEPAPATTIPSLAKEIEVPKVEEKIQPEVKEEKPVERIPEVVEEAPEPEQDESPPDNNQIREWSDGERLWKAEYLEEEIGFWYSEDSGLTWNQNEKASISILTNDFSVEGDSSQVYIVYTDGFDIMSMENSNNYPAPDFTWNGEPLKIYNGHSLSYNYSRPYITKDKEGKLWTSAFFFTTEIQEHTYVVDDTDAQAYEADDGDGDFAGSENEFTEANYLSIDDDDSNYVEHTGAASSTYQYHRFDFTIDEDTADITQVDVTYKAIGTCLMNQPMCGFGASLWVKESDTWTEKDAGTSPAKETFTAQYTSDFADIISSGHMHVGGQSEVPGVSRLDASLLDSFYAEVKVTYDDGVEIPEGTIPFFLVAPFLPRLIYNLRNRKKKRKGRNITINLITVVLLALSLFYLVFANAVFDYSNGEKEKYYKIATKQIPNTTDIAFNHTLNSHEIARLLEEAERGPRKTSYNSLQFIQSIPMAILPTPMEEVSNIKKTKHKKSK